MGTIRTGCIVPPLFGDELYYTNLLSLLTQCTHVYFQLYICVTSLFLTLSFLSPPPPPHISLFITLFAHAQLHNPLHSTSKGRIVSTPSATVNCPLWPMRWWTWRLEQEPSRSPPPTTTMTMTVGRGTTYPSLRWWMMMETLRTSVNSSRCSACDWSHDQSSTLSLVFVCSMIKKLSHDIIHTEHFVACSPWWRKSTISHQFMQK